MISRAIRIGAILLGLVAATSYGASIVIDDSGDGNPIVTTDLPNLEVTPGLETVTVSGTLPTSIGLLSTGARQVIYSEPAGDFNPPNSDIVALDIEGGANGAPQSIRLVFASDATGSVSPLPGITNTVTVPESTLSTNTPKWDVSTYLGLASGSGLTIVAISDANTAETPVPASAWAGMALLGGLAIWRIVRRRAASLA